LKDAIILPFIFVPENAILTIVFPLVFSYEKRSNIHLDFEAIKMII
jgi:hypothetical protein